MARSGENWIGAATEKGPSGGPPVDGSPPSGADSDNSIVTLAQNYRYVAASNEVSTRIGLRQNALTIFVTLSTGILAILATAPRTGFPIDVNFLTLLMPAVSFFLALLNFKHDKTIALLRQFMRECERSGSAVRLGLPGYNLAYRTRAEALRNFHDYSAALLILVFNGLGLFIAYHSVPSMSDLRGLAIVVYIGVTIGSIVLVMHSTFRRDVDQRAS